jgi:hypothetical protein
MLTTMRAAARCDKLTTRIEDEGHNRSMTIMDVVEDESLSKTRGILVQRPLLSVPTVRGFDTSNGD